MQETAQSDTVQAEIKSYNLVKLLYSLEPRYQFSESEHLKVSQNAFEEWGHGIQNILESALDIKILDITIQCLLKHVVRISVNSEMVGCEALVQLTQYICIHWRRLVKNIGGGVNGVNS